MFEIKVSQEIKDACPVFAGAAVYAAVKNTAYCEGLWKEINAFTEELTTTTQIEDIKHQPVIAATREAYKRCGKDPGRYRPSAEALRRRLMRGIPLYQIDTLVDLINLVSLRTGHSIGGFDADKIQGAYLELGIGKAGEPFEGIGKGVLNIEGLPVYRQIAANLSFLNNQGSILIENEKIHERHSHTIIRLILSDDCERTRQILFFFQGGKPYPCGYSRIVC